MKTITMDQLREAGYELIAEPTSNGSKKSNTIKLSEVQPEPIEWLWHRYVPRAMPTVVGGFPGVGKSTLVYDLAARTSREDRIVVIATAEDHLAAVVRPRLEAAGADLDKVVAVTAELTLPADVELLERLVRSFSAAMVMLDPLVAFIGDDINTHRDHQVRRVLAPLSVMAESTGAALVVIVHTNKGRETEPLMRISGSIGFTGAARTVLLAADDPKDDNRRILAVVKSNLSEFPPPLAYRIVGVDLGDGIRTSRVDWLGEAVEVDVRELLAGQDTGERSDRETAIEFLRESGVQDQAQPAGELMKSAAGMNIGEKTLQRARRSLGIPAWLEFVGGPWWWGPRRLDTPSGHAYPSRDVQSALPAETPPESPRLDSVDRVGEPLHPPCDECGRPWHQGHGRGLLEEVGVNVLPIQCAEPGCPRKALEGARCPVHRRTRWIPSGGYGSDWRHVRDAYIREHPICEWPGCSAPSVEVDHIVRVKVDPSRRLDPTNLRALCVEHHRSRTGRDGARAQAEARRARGER